MKAQGYGRIVVTTSSTGLYGNFGQTNYGAAKLSLVGFMNSLKLEGAKDNIKVNAVCPVAATRSAHRQPPELRQFVCAHLLNRRRHGGGAGCARSVRATSSSQLGQAPPMSTRRQNKLQSGQRRWPR